MRTRSIFLALLLPLSAACRQDMHDQPRYEPLEASDFFADGRSARPDVPGTVARGELQLDLHLIEGRINGEFAETFPFPITAEVLEHGQERFNIFCSVCHGASGNGLGMVVKRGMKQPTSFHVERLQQSPPGYFFDVITNGYGVMYDYSARLSPRDRWAVVAYIRTLQFSQAVDASALPQEDRSRLEGIQ